jgi:hypothetical protein
MRRFLREKIGNAKPRNPQGWQTAKELPRNCQGGPKMQPHEPISVFQKPEPTASSKRFSLSAPQRAKLSCALAALSALVLIVLIAAEVASV